MSAFDERRITITSGALELEAAIHDGDGALAALVLHPHPQYGGDMDNHVVTAICGAFAGRGATTLRFNFRGVGRSEGTYGDGQDEADDARSALATLRTAVPSGTITLAGYSFGAMIAASIAGDAGLNSLVLVSPPFGAASLDGLDAGIPTLVVTGDRDQVSPAGAARALAAERRRVVVVPGADHSWWPGVDSLVAETGAFMDTVALGAETP